MGFPETVVVTFKEDLGFPCPPKNFRAKMMTAVKNLFAEELPPEYAPFRDLAGRLWHSIFGLLKHDKMMVKIKDIDCD